jgi:prophage antirepressor-like protein
VTVSGNNLVPFAFGENLVRALKDENGEPLFVAKDVALALGYEWNGAARLAHVPEEWKVVTSVVTHSRGKQEMLTLTEQGLYFFLARSDKPKALPFQKWLAGDVLPAIRRTGGYSLAGRGGGAALPEAVARLRPVLRERILGHALRVASIVGVSSQEEVDSIFLRLCEMVGGDTGAGELRFHDPQAEQEMLIRRFAEECLVQRKEHRLSVRNAYRAFEEWWRRGEFGGKSRMPTIHRFGKAVRQLYSGFKLGGKVYFSNVGFREA